MSFIYEFPHPEISILYNPKEGNQCDLDHVWDALTRGADAIEIHCLRRWDGAVVFEHDRGDVNRESVTLDDVLRLVICLKGGSPTVYNDNRQFFLMVEPKERDDDLCDGIHQTLRHPEFAPHLSTVVDSGGPPRGITIVISGEANYFYDYIVRHHLEQQINRLCIIDYDADTDPNSRTPDTDFENDITNLSPDGTPFRWMVYEYDQERGHVNDYHSQNFNVRVWGGDQDELDDLKRQIRYGVDCVSVREWAYAPLRDSLQHQEPRGSWPCLGASGGNLLLTWSGEGDSTNLYVARGTVQACGLSFTRQLNFTGFLNDGPLANGPACALLPDGRILIVYQGTSAERLWYVCGYLSDGGYHPILVGQEHELTLPNDVGRRGGPPGVAVAADGRVLVVYEGTDYQRLWYVSGFLDDQGEFRGKEYELTEGDARRGYTPSVAMYADGGVSRVIVVYEGTSDHRLWYVSGVLDSHGQISHSQEFELTRGDERRGYTPSVAFDDDGRLLIVYEGTDSNRLWYVSGLLTGNGQIEGQEFELTRDDARRGSHPTGVFYRHRHYVVVYQGTEDQKLWYVKGTLDDQGRLQGPDRLLDMNLARTLRSISSP